MQEQEKFIESNWELEADVAHIIERLYFIDNKLAEQNVLHNRIVELLTAQHDLKAKMTATKAELKAAEKAYETAKAEYIASIGGK